MPTAAMTPRNLTFTKIPDRGWSRRYDHVWFSVEACMYTEGYIDFYSEGELCRRCLFLLELFLETKSVLLANVGANSFDAEVWLPFSANRFMINRARDQMQINERHNVLLSAPWNGFLADFMEFEAALAREMRHHFPKMAGSREFALIF